MQTPTHDTSEPVFDPPDLSIQSRCKRDLRAVLNDFEGEDQETKLLETYEQYLTLTAAKCFDEGQIDDYIEQVVSFRNGIQLLQSVGDLTQTEYEFWTEHIQLAENVKSITAITKRAAAAGNITQAVKLAFTSGVLYRDLINSCRDDSRQKKLADIGKAIAKVLADSNLARKEEREKSAAAVIAELKRRYSRTGGSKTAILKNMAKDATGKWGGYSTLVDYCKDVELN